MTIERHFTVTGFVVHDDHTLLHWHPKVKMWLPPGGHIDENEDPVQAVLREIEEETGVQAEVVPTNPFFADLDYPVQVPAPYTIMVEDIHDPVNGFHYHIDMIYFCKLVSSREKINDGWLWVSKKELSEGKLIDTQFGPSEPPPEDVRLLAREAFYSLKMRNNNTN